MKKRRIVIVVIFAAIAICGLILSSNREPTYEGKPVSYWLRVRGEGRNPDTLRKSEEAFEAFGLEAIPFIFREVEQANGSFQSRLREVWPKLPEFLKKSISEPLPARDVEMAAKNTLSLAGPSGIPIFIEGLEDRSVHIRELSAFALSTLQRNGHDVSESLPMLAQLLNDEDAGVRISVTGILEQLGTRSADAVPALIQLLNDEKARSLTNTFFVRAGAARALGKIGPAATEALPVLEEIATDSQTTTTCQIYTSMEATIAMWRISGETTNTVRRLIELWPQIDNHSKWEIMEAFGEMGPAAAEARPLLTAVVDNNFQFTPRTRGAPALRPPSLNHATNALLKIDPDYFLGTNNMVAE